MYTDYRRPLGTFTQTISTVIALHFYKLAWSGGPGESHPRAPTERNVTVSRHSALLILSSRMCASISSE